MTDSKQLTLDAQIQELYSELRRLAASKLRQVSGPAHTLSATGLVNEAYLKLASNVPAWQNRGHFMGIAANAMRQILVNHAVAKNAEKRGAGWSRLTLTTAESAIEAQQMQNSAGDIDIVALDTALSALAKLDARQAQIVEMRYFAGLSIEDTATALDLSPATVKRQWSVARLFLKQNIKEQQNE
jgi:RNA polymerase sigma-70 factor, ECF subfamily